MHSVLIERNHEQRVLQEAVVSPDPELIAVYGRRRIGKTFLVRQHFGPAIAFELTGSHAGDMATQLEAFATAMGRATGAPAPLAAPADWTAAFRQLETYLGGLRKPRRGKRVVFFDELPWLATRRSGFLTAFEHFWNSWASAQPWLILVICGSSASWMLRKVVKQRGGLHNRVTRRIRLEPFTLAQCASYLEARNVRLDHRQLLELYMAFGGVPHYLNEARRGWSAAQTIEHACFQREGALRDEFGNLYHALFENADRHEAVIRALAQRGGGLERSDLLAAAGLPTGGTATKVLEELEESGFIGRSVPLGHTLRDSRYYLDDEYSLFYLTWIEKHRGTAEGAWLAIRAGGRFRAWSGLAFERVCFKHASLIKRALGIAALQTEEAAWAHRPESSDDDGAQIDLVIDRADRCVNLCEMKFSESEFVIDKGYARQLSRKRDIYLRVTGSKKAAFITLVTTYGVRDNQHAQQLGVQVVTMDALFKR